MPLVTLPLYFFFLEEFYTRNHLGLRDEGGGGGGRWGAGGGETNGDYQLHECENVRERKSSFNGQFSEEKEPVILWLTVKNLITKAYVVSKCI